jgi:hypothetical protein
VSLFRITLNPFHFWVKMIEIKPEVNEAEELADLLPSQNRVDPAAVG